VFPNVQTVVAQVVAAVLVVGSYFLAEELRVRRPRRRGVEVAERPSGPPPAPGRARVATLERR
jgi:high-affinity iron transporter